VCSDQNAIIVDFLDLNEVDAGMGGDVCGLAFNLNAIAVTGFGQWSKLSGPGNVVFSPSDASVNVTVTADDYGDYVFQWYETLDNCVGSDTLAVSFHMQPLADAGPDQVLEFVFSTYLNARIPEIGKGHWEVERGSGHFADENDPVSLVTELELGVNEFIWIIQSAGCEEASDKVIVTVNDINTPTVITPNNDGQNDFLVFPGVEQQSGSELIIYNRWGTEVYRSSDYQNDWEGMDHKNRALNPDTYYYILKIESERIIKGFVEIRR
jgi:gliding motility-associated-like protein